MSNAREKYNLAYVMHAILYVIYKDTDLLAKFTTTSSVLAQVKDLPTPEFFSVTVDKGLMFVWEDPLCSSRRVFVYVSPEGAGYYFEKYVSKADCRGFYNRLSSSPEQLVEFTSFDAISGGTKLLDWITCVFKPDCKWTTPYVDKTINRYTTVIMFGHAVENSMSLGEAIGKAIGDLVYSGLWSFSPAREKYNKAGSNDFELTAFCEGDFGVVIEKTIQAVRAFSEKT